MADMSDGSDDEDYHHAATYTASEPGAEKRYPIHDACEFEDIEALKRLILEPIEDEEDDEEEEDEDDDEGASSSRRGGGGTGDEDESSSDENGSTAAAHAAATGHSPVVPASSGGKPKNDDDDDDDKKKSEKEEDDDDAENKGGDSTAAALNGSETPVNTTSTSPTPPHEEPKTPRASNASVKQVAVEGAPAPAADTADAAKQSDDQAVAESAGKDAAARTEEAEDAKNSEAPAPAPPEPMDVDETENSGGGTSTANEADLSDVAAALMGGSTPSVAEIEAAAAAADRAERDVVTTSPKEDDAAAAEEESDSHNHHNTNNKQQPPPPPASASSSGSVPASPRTATRYRLAAGVNLNEKDDDDNTALHLAIHARQLEHVQLLLEMGASFRLKCDGSFAVHTALAMGSVRQHQAFSLQCLQALHEAGADLTLKDDSNHSPLFLACMFNLPAAVHYILQTDEGHATLNVRADRAGNRPLHAAAKFDTLSNPGTVAAGTTITLSSSQSSTTTKDTAKDNTRGAIVTPKPIPGFPGKTVVAPTTKRDSGTHNSNSNNNHQNKEADAVDTTSLVTRILLDTAGIEVDAINGLGQTALHVACGRGNWPVARLLLSTGGGADAHIADRRGFTPGQVAYKRGMPIPADLRERLGDPPESGLLPAPRDLLVDPDGGTAILSHELCWQHRTCAPIRRDEVHEPPPENVRRLQVLLDDETGILKTGEFRSGGDVHYKTEAPRARMADVLKCHEYAYIEKISGLTSSIPDHPTAIRHVDPDTAVSRWSFEAALRAAGSVCHAVDLVVSAGNSIRNAFCAVRPPGHHAGPRGIVQCATDPEGGSHGFCLLNNVAIGAAYARSMYRHEGIHKVAILDFDVHHGNGTQEIIRQLVPTTERVMLSTPFGTRGEWQTSTYRPWLDETDIQNVFFCSTHGYGPRGYDAPALGGGGGGGWFYPASGKTHTSESITHPAMVEQVNLTDFLNSQTWARMGATSQEECCKILNVGLALPEPTVDVQGRNMKQRLELRDVYRHDILPHLREFDPDLIFVSAGFDAHRKDGMNFGYIGMVEDDYEWLTEQIVKLANTTCHGRVVSVLEGGYKIHGGIVSPFARSVAAHVRALQDGAKSRELLDLQDVEWEAQYERHVLEKRERKKEDDRERLRLKMQATLRGTTAAGSDDGDAPPDDVDAALPRKRRRGAGGAGGSVDYKELYKQMQQEGFASG